MQILKSTLCSKNQPLGILIGNFDGVHLGHAFLISKFRARCESIGVNPLLITFSPHPKLLFNPDLAHSLMNEDFKIKILEEYVDVSILEFNHKLQQLTRDEFLLKLFNIYSNVKFVMFGFDTLLGSDRLGLDKSLSDRFTKICFEVSEQFIFDQTIVSSSLIRKLVGNGEIEYANFFTLTPYSIHSTIIHGDKIGRTIGYPTANLKVPKSQVLPKFGVYLCTLKVENKSYLALTNIGERPTVVDSKETRIEVHILDFDGDIYGEKITVYFHKFLREEKSFSSINELKENISDMKKLIPQFNFALVGKNISHSKSGELYRKLLQFSVGYDLFDLEVSQLEDFVKKSINNYSFINITAPHKYFFSKITSNSQRKDLCNLLIPNSLQGSNTDYLAIKDILSNLNYDHYFCLGDGAMSAIVRSLGMTNLSIYSRKAGNLDSLYTDIESKRGTILVINCCSRSYVFENKVSRDFDFWDMNYSFQAHSWMKQTTNINYLDGTFMLMLQAKYALRFWNFKKN